MGQPVRNLIEVLDHRAELVGDVELVRVEHHNDEVRTRREPARGTRRVRLVRGEGRGVST